MKKNIWIGVGAVLLLAGIIMVGQKKAQSASGLSSEESDHGGSFASTTADENVERTSLSAHDRDGQAEMPAPQLSQPVKALLGLDGKKHNYPSLLAAIDGLGDEISTDDLTALMNMLIFPNDRFPEGMRSIEINAVKNDVLDRLLRQKVLPEGLGLQMVVMAGNADNDPVWRDYCIPFCPTVWERIDAEC